MNDDKELAAEVFQAEIEKAKVSKVIRQEGKEFSVYSESGKRLGGPYSSRGEAERRLAQVEYWKHKKTGHELAAGIR